MIAVESERWAASRSGIVAPVGRDDWRGLLLVVATFVLGIALAVGWAFFVLLVLGQGECDRGECNALGEFTFDSDWGLTVILILAFAIAAAVVWGVSRFRR